MEVSAETEETADALTLRIEGPGVAFFLDDDADVLEGLDHLLQRMYGGRWPGRLVVTCQGYKTERDEGLRRAPWSWRRRCGRTACRAPRGR